MLVGGTGGVAQAVGDGSPAVTAHGVGAFGQNRNVPFAHHFGVVLQFAQDVPVALKEHGALLGEEGRAGSGLGKVVLVGAPVVFLQVDVEFHAHLGGRVGEVCAGLVLGQDAAARLVHKVPVTQLIVAVGHVTIFAGGIVNFLGSLTQIVPGPGFVGVGDAGGVEHLLVVHKADGVFVLGYGVQFAVRTAGVGQRNVREVLGLHNVGAVGQLAVVGILQDFVGVHPEDVRHLVGDGSRFQLGPVLIPAGDLHFNVDVGMLLGVSVTHRLHAVTLGNVPDLERQVHGAVGTVRAASGQARCQTGGQARRHQPGNQLPFDVHKMSSSC